MSRKPDDSLIETVGSFLRLDGASLHGLDDEEANLIIGSVTALALDRMAGRLSDGYTMLRRRVPGVPAVGQHVHLTHTGQNATVVPAIDDGENEYVHVVISGREHVATVPPFLLHPLDTTEDAVLNDRLICAVAARRMMMIQMEPDGLRKQVDSLRFWKDMSGSAPAP